MFVDVNVRERARSVGRSHAHGEGRGVLRGARPAGKIKFLRGQVSAVVGVLVSVSVSLALRCVCSEKGFQILSVGVNLQPPRMMKNICSCNITAAAVVRPFLEEKNQNTRRNRATVPGNFDPRVPLKDWG